MRQYDTVIFDLDGTLLDTLEDLTDAVNYALRECSMQERSVEEIRSFVGNGIVKLMQRAVLGGTDNPKFEKAFELFKTYYGAHCNDKTSLYPGVKELLMELKADGCKLAIVSNKADFAVKELQKIYFEGIIEVAIGEKEDVHKKPAPDTVIKALTKLQSTRERAVYIGDSEVDIQTAANAKLPCISVTWGFRDVEFLKAQGAVRLAANTREVKEYIDGNCK